MILFYRSVDGFLRGCDTESVWQKMSNSRFSRLLLSYHTNTLKECPVSDRFVSLSVAFATSLLMRQFKGMCCTPFSFPRTHGEPSLGDLCRIEVGACCCHNEIVKEASFERNCLFPPTFPTILPVWSSCLPCGTPIVLDCWSSSSSSISGRFGLHIHPTQSRSGSV